MMVYNLSYIDPIQCWLLFWNRYVFFYLFFFAKMGKKKHKFFITPPPFFLPQYKYFDVNLALSIKLTLFLSDIN